MNSNGLYCIRMKSSVRGAFYQHAITVIRIWQSSSYIWGISRIDIPAWIRKVAHYFHHYVK